MTFTPWQSRGAACASALLLAAAFPPLNWWPLALVALVPVLLGVWSSARSKAPSGMVSRTRFWPGFRLGWLFGFVFFTATLWWIQHVTLPGMLALTCYLALYPAVAMGIAGWLGMRPADRWPAIAGKVLLIAGIWAGLEWARSVALSGFPWNSLAVPLFEVAAARWAAAGIGVIGVSGLVLLFPLAAAAAIHRRGGRSGFFLCGWAAGGIVLAVAVRISGTLDASRAGAFHQAALVQTNLTMEQKMSPHEEEQRQRYFDLENLTTPALEGGGKGGIDLVIWPESAVPGYFDAMVAGGAFADLIQEANFTLVTGADHEEYGNLYNTVAALRRSPDQTAVHPDVGGERAIGPANYLIHPKIRLVPFGEFIPFRREVPLFETMLGGLIPLDFSRGTSLEPMRLGDQPFSIIPLVCFEDTIGDHARKFIRPEPQVIVNVTNDNWFHQSPATEMHFANARWRAPELNRTLLRSANTGVTAIVSPQGDVQRIPSFRRDVLTGTFRSGDGSVTFYAKHGDLFSQAAGALALAGCGVVCWRRRRAPVRMA